MDSEQSKKQGANPQGTQGAAKETTVDKQAPDNDKSGQSSPSNLAKDDYFDLLSPARARQVPISDLVGVQVVGTADVTILTKDQFESRYVKGKKTVAVKHNDTNTLYEGYELEKGQFLVIGPNGNEHFDNKEKLATRYNLLG